MELLELHHLEFVLTTLFEHTVELLELHQVELAETNAGVGGS
jgi:hypothetical protein